MPIPRVRLAFPKIKETLTLLRLAARRVDSGGVEAEMRDRLARREDMFLHMAARHIFARAESPYRPLFDIAGYDFERLRQLVRSRGLDAALDQLWHDGVFIGIREFKGQQPIRRGPHTFHVQQSDFVNPDVVPVLHSWSSGSRGAGAQSGVSAEAFFEGTRLWGWLLRGYGLTGRDIIIWQTPRMGLSIVLKHIALRWPPRRWFSLGQVERTYHALARAASLVTQQRVPRPQLVEADGVMEIARYIARSNTSRGMVVQAMVSSALRLVRAAEDASLTLGDVVFLVGGEPLTPAKQRQFESRGYRIISAFATSEFGTAAWSCPDSAKPDDLHVLTDRAALRQHPRPVEGNGDTLPAYLFTSLLPQARHIMVNVESGDYGGMRNGDCGCFLQRAGLHQHMHTVRSFEKLTAEGVTFFGPTLIGLLEEVLPREFGGGGSDYQLVEAEDSGGQTRLYVLASPTLGPLDEQALRRTVLREIRDRHVSAGAGRQIHNVWERSGTIQVLRRVPLETRSGKIHHLHRHEGALGEGRQDGGEGA